MRTLALLLTLAAVGCSGSDAGAAAIDASDPVDSSAADAGAARLDAAAGGGSDSGAPKTDPAIDAGMPTNVPMDRDADTQPSPDAGSAPPADKDAGAVKVPQLEALPSCVESGFGFDQTAPERDGPVSIAFSAWLQPLGVDERAEIQILNDQGDVDDGYNGTLSWRLPDGVELVSASQVVAGEAEATFRFTKLGNARVAAQLSGDARTGFADVIAYATQLPIWELEVDPDDLARIESDPESAEEIQGMLVVDGVPHATALRLHGASSRYFPKKSFRFDLSEMGGVELAFGKKLVLRAEYNDKSLLRNWLALRMFRANTRIPTPRSQLVHFRVNGRYYGVMHNVERVASRLLDAWGLATNGSLYESDPEDAFLDPGGNLTPVTPAADYPHVYQHQGGTIDYTDLRAFIEETLTLPDDKFATAIEQELEVGDYIDYLAMMAAIQNLDQVRKNFYLYRDPLQARGWRVLPWDLDLTFGHVWSEENDVLEEEIASDADVFVGVHVPERGGFYNQLIDRLLTQPTYRARFLTRLNALLSTGLTRSAAEAMLANTVCRATPDILADSQKRASNDEYAGRVAEIGDFLDARWAYVQSLP